jgi:AraC family transcriptional regulator, chitin signaling transcriptional activator
MVMPKSSKIRLSFLTLFLWGVLAASAQVLPEKGVPLLQSFMPAQYHHKGKIWDISSAPNGIVYMAADKGLLEYDGKTWNSFKGSNGITRSLLIANDSLIYTGSDLDFGVWKKNKYQSFEYGSLYPFQEAAQDINEEFWEVHQLKEDVVFVSSQNIYIYKSEQLVKIAAPSRFSKSFRVEDTLYFADEKQGLYLFDGFSLEKVFGYPENIKLEISGVYRQEKGLIIVTRDLGLYRYEAGNLSSLNNALSESLKIAKVFSYEPIGKTHLAFGTVLKGLYIADLEGNIIHHINRYKGLPSNTVLSLHYSPAGKLWLGMDYGVSALDLKNDFTAIYDYRGDFGTGYTALLKDGIFYLGTNQGLYRSKWEELNDNLEFFRFQLVPQTAGQVWTLENIDHTLLMGHDKGLFVVQENSVEKLNSQEGVWTILPYQDYLLTGNYNGISIFRKSGANWDFWKKMDLILGSCNQLIVEKDNILWVNIPNFGVIRAVLNEDLNPADRLIFPEKTFEGNAPSLLKDERGIHLVTDRFQYTYDAASREFLQKAPSKAFSSAEALLSGRNQTRALHPDYEFHPTHNGFILKHLKSGDETATANYALLFRKAEAFNNDERVAVYPGAKVPHRLNNFSIEYIVPNCDDVLYQYKLNDPGQWSSWASDNSIELIGLKHGEYTISVRAQIAGEITSTNVIRLRIAAPWHRSWPALAAYLMLIIMAVLAMLRWRKISLKKQKEKLLLKEREALQKQAEQHQQEILLLEQERLHTEYRQLKQQLRNKTIELANKARENEEKNRLLLALKEKFEVAQENPSSSKTKWKEIERLLDSYLQVDDKTFEIQMDELHQEFFKKLKAQFPALSSNDLRLCAYLKIGLNSKEIAEMLNIQPSSFYISRSRLRKKLELETDENLYDFLNKV